MLNHSPSPSSRVCMVWVPSWQFNKRLCAETCNVYLLTFLPWLYSYHRPPLRIYDPLVCYFQSDDWCDSGWQVFVRRGTGPAFSRGPVHFGVMDDSLKLYLWKLLFSLILTERVVCAAVLKSVFSILKSVFLRNWEIWVQLVCCEGIFDNHLFSYLLLIVGKATWTARAAFVFDVSYLICVLIAVGRDELEIPFKEKKKEATKKTRNQSRAVLSLCLCIRLREESKWK